MFDFEKHIVFEDDVLLVCHKPAGLMVEPDRNNFPILLHDAKNYIKGKQSNSLPYIQHLHRLDRPTEGLVLFTKDKAYLKHLSEQFANREVEKYYYALTLNSPTLLSGKLENWHRKEKKKACIVDESTAFAELAKLEYQCQEKNKLTLWNIKLLTGKYHQIRAQLSHINCPIIGDTLYGSTETYKTNAIALFAYRLKIKHPKNLNPLDFNISDKIIRELEYLF